MNQEEAITPRCYACNLLMHPFQTNFEKGFRFLYMHLDTNTT